MQQTSDLGSVFSTLSANCCNLTTVDLSYSGEVLSVDKTAR